MTAFFRNNTMTALDRNDANHPPSIFAPIPEDREAWTELQAAIKDTSKRIETRKSEAQPDFQKWLASSKKAKRQETDSTLTLHLPMLADDGELTGTVDGIERTWAASPERIDGPLGKAVVVTGSEISLGDIANFSREDQVTYGGFVWFEKNTTGSIIAKISVDESLRGWDLGVEDGKIVSHIIDSWDKSANKLFSRKKVDAGKWHHVMVTFDGSRSGHQAMSLFIDGERFGARIYPNTVGGDINTATPLRLGSRSNGDNQPAAKVALQDFRFYRRILSKDEISQIANLQKMQTWAALPASERDEKQNQALFEYFVSSVDQPSIDLLRELDRLNKEEKAFRDRGSMTLVYREKADSKPNAHVLIRGAYTAKGEEVFPATPAMLPSMPEGAPKDRRGLAMWLNDPANPLPARVTMNRLWYYFFGTGIVETNGDFGIMGARPSHPKLLDWLASEFIESDWNFRHMAKTIVMSQAYRQSVHISPEKLEIDPDNRLISRGPRTRLDAEQIRDLALASSGLLSEKVGGAPVKPYQPEGVWNAVAMPQSNTRNYKQDSGEALYRRSLYTFWKRTAAPPTMEILNAPSREVFCVAREQTNTPLQALALMNDPQLVEANRVLATEAMQSSESFHQRLDFISLNLLNRSMSTDEKAAVQKTFESATAYYTQRPEQARLAISVGEKPVDDSLPEVELAAWSLIANQIFNLDETVTR